MGSLTPRVSTLIRPGAAMSSARIGAAWIASASSTSMAVAFLMTSLTRAHATPTQVSRTTRLLKVPMAALTTSITSPSTSAGIVGPSQPSQITSPG